MKILLIDHPGFQLDARKTMIEADVADSIIETANTLGEVYALFKKGAFDLVIIDHRIENGQECVDYILRHDPMQPMLVVSDARRCVIRECEQCVQNHMIRRLNNPTPIHNIVRMVLRFDMYSCDHYGEQERD